MRRTTVSTAVVTVLLALTGGTLTLQPAPAPAGRPR
jgi:hypothetical protein